MKETLTSAVSVLKAVSNNRVRPDNPSLRTPTQTFRLAKTKSCQDKLIRSFFKTTLMMPYVFSDDIKKYVIDYSNNF